MGKEGESCMCGSISGTVVSAQGPDHGKGSRGSSGSEKGRKGKGGKGGKGARGEDEMFGSESSTIFIGASVAGGVLVTLVVAACWRWRSSCCCSSSKTKSV